MPNALSTAPTTTRPPRPISGQIITFAAVGVVNTATYYGLYLLFLRYLPYLAAHVIAFVLSMIGSFFLNARFTYRIRPTWRKFLLFPLTNATNFVITTVGVYRLREVRFRNCARSRRPAEVWLALGRASNELGD
ncbi:GtrA family protein, partial [Streptomyces sp. NPDC007162]|uniref:GtrA family protein n=1 Tax=Streptomyces sp. NPDC007162 TaxID=3156917 RepID=UPI0033E30DA6